MSDREPRFLNSHNLYGTARAAVQRLGPPIDAKSAGHEDALVAIIFAACTLESLVHDVAIIAGSFAQISVAPPSFAHLADAVEEMENSRVSTRLKYLFAKRTFPGVAFEKGKEPYQSLDLLFSLRDNIVHMKPSSLDISESKVFRALQSRGLCDAPSDKMRNWVNEIATPAVATWACATVCDVAETFYRDLSELGFPPANHQFYQALIEHLPRGIAGT